MSAAAGTKYSLVVEGGTLVIPGVGLVNADVGIRDGKIVALGNDLAGRAEDVLDARGKTVLPGIFDPHVHIGNERSFEEEAESETRAAVLGGVTTIGIFLRSLDESYMLHLPAFRRAMDELSYVNSVFHPQIFTEEQIAEIPRYAKDFGIRSFKFYMSGMPGIVKSVTDDVLLHGFRTVAGLGPDAIACVHCETGALIDRARSELQKKKEGTLADWELAHPADAEALAIQTALYLSRVAGAHLYVVHLSSRQGLEVVRNARRQGMRFTVETTTPYLGIDSDDPNGFLVKMVPPVVPRTITMRFGRACARAPSIPSAPTIRRARAQPRGLKPGCTARDRAFRRWERICPRCCITDDCAASRSSCWWIEPPALRRRSTASILRRAR